ncbi:ExeA family protein [Alkalilacustris brevis]|uniref:ExeA family protein n=1 Tax=Alkalilacustris brevis TaxID=2026338 RepID=UPI000E0DAE6C|nr:AAA family ATPase [Alkalilacustris brevis]
MAPTQDIYLEHFNLAQRPFSLVPDPEFLFWSRAHRGAYAMLEYGLVTRAPITLITGEIGVGKTTLLHHFLNGLAEDVSVGFIANARRGTSDLLRWVMPTLSLEAPDNASDVVLFDRFQHYLIHEYGEGRRVLLAIDEAQNLSREALEELRMLTNINANKDELLQLVLVGQPELRDTVRRPDMTQFAQRVAANYHIPAMDAPTVLGYIAHRLTVAGGKPDLFSRQAADLVQEATNGVPRLVNQLCDLSMTYAFSAGQRRVRRATVMQVLDDGVFFAGGLNPHAPVPQ